MNAFRAVCRRLLWACLKDIHPDWECSDIDRWFYRLFFQFKVSTPFKAIDFLEVNEEVCRAIADRLKMPLMSEFTVVEREIGNDGWKNMNLNIYRANGFVWLLDPDTHHSKSLIEYHCFRPRVIDSLFLLDVLFPPGQCEEPFELIDVNPTLERMLESYVDEDFKLKDSLGARSPWKSWSPTLVVSGRLVVRHKIDGLRPGASCYLHNVRLVEPFEAFRLVGWCESMWLPFEKEVTVRDMGVMLNIAGNAFSAFHYLPWICGMHSTWGRFMHAPPQKPAEDMGRPLITVADSESEGESEE